MWDNFKGLLKDDTTFYGLIIGFVAVCSFGLGRLSVDNTTINSDIVTPINSAAVANASLPTLLISTTSLKSIEETVPQNEEVLYVGSKNSDKYHLPWCSGAKRITESNKVFFNSKAEAEAAGYTPAGNCKGI